MLITVAALNSDPAGRVLSLWAILAFRERLNAHERHVLGGAQSNAVPDAVTDTVPDAVPVDPDSLGPMDAEEPALEADDGGGEEGGEGDATEGQDAA